MLLFNSVNYSNHKLKQKIMASKNTKAKIKAAISTMPVNPIKLTIYSEVKQSALDSNMKIDGVSVHSVPKQVVNEIVITQLKGFQYGKEFTELMENFEHADFYKGTKVLMQSRSGNVVPTTMLTLTSGMGLHSFMLSNAVKLYLLPHEIKTNMGVRDANYSEICGMYQQDADNLEKAYVSKDMTKMVKEDIKTVATARAIQDQENYAGSPLRTLAQQTLLIVSPEKVANYLEQKKQEREEKKKTRQIGYTK
jgi:hypothetical protein